MRGPVSHLGKTILMMPIREAKSLTGAPEFELPGSEFGSSEWDAESVRPEAESNMKICCDVYVRTIGNCCLSRMITQRINQRHAENNNKRSTRVGSATFLFAGGRPTSEPKTRKGRTVFCPCLVDSQLICEYSSGLQRHSEWFS